MSTKYNASLFESLQDTFNNKTNSDSVFKDFLKFETDKMYIVRLVPNTEDINNSWYEYKQHIFKSAVHGKNVSVICPNTYKEKCPICEYRSKIWATENKTLIEQIKPLKKSEKWLYNAYVVSDPTNPKNNGQVKYLNAGSQLNDVITAALFGIDKAEFGSKIFDLSPNGCNLRIMVEKNEGGYPKYSSSRFISPSKIDGLETDAAMDAVYDSFKPYNNIFTAKTYDQVKAVLDEHFLGAGTAAKQPEANAEEEQEFKVDDSAAVTGEAQAETPAAKVLSEQEKRMQKIIEDL